MNEFEKQVLTKFKLPLKYDEHGQMVFDQDNRQVLDIRAWGYLQKFPQPEKIQDALGEMVVKAFNEKYYINK